MSSVDILRAWKDEAYRNSLSETERANLPANPAGVTDLSAAELAAIDGGAAPGGFGAVSQTCCACTHHCNPRPTTVLNCRPKPTFLCRTVLCRRSPALLGRLRFASAGCRFF